MRGFGRTSQPCLCVPLFAVRLRALAANRTATRKQCSKGCMVPIRYQTTLSPVVAWDLGAGARVNLLTYV